MSAVTAPGLAERFRKASDWAVYSCTAPSSARACAPLDANSAGTATGDDVSVASDRIAPGDKSERANGAPKFELLATSKRLASSTSPGRVSAANSRLSRIGPPGWKKPTGLRAPAPGIPDATSLAVSRCGRSSPGVSGVLATSGTAVAPGGGSADCPLQPSSCPSRIVQLRWPSEKVARPVSGLKTAWPRLVFWIARPVASTSAHAVGEPISLGSCRARPTNAPAKDVAVP